TLAVGVTAVAVRSFSRGFYIDFICHGEWWEVVCEQGRIRLDNFPQVNLERREILRQQRIAEVYERVYMAAMFDPRASAESRSFEIALAANAVDANRAYAAAKAELARL